MEVAADRVVCGCFCLLICLYPERIFLLRISLDNTIIKVKDFVNKQCRRFDYEGTFYRRNRNN